MVDLINVDLADLRGHRRFDVGVTVVCKAAQVAANLRAEVAVTHERHHTLVVLVVRRDAIAIQRHDADDHRRRRVERDRLAVLGSLPLGADFGDVRVEGAAGITPSTV